MSRRRHKHLCEYTCCEQCSKSVAAVEEKAVPINSKSNIYHKIDGRPGGFGFRGKGEEWKLSITLMMKC